MFDLRIDHERFGRSSDPSLNGHLHYPNDIDRSLNEVATDKIRKYRADYNNNPPNSISFIPVITSTSGRLHSDFVFLLFLQTHRETWLNSRLSSRKMLTWRSALFKTFFLHYRLVRFCQHTRLQCTNSHFLPKYQGYHRILIVFSCNVRFHPEYLQFE